MAQQVAKDCVVALRYIMRNEKGEVLEDTMRSAPVNYLHGAAGILPLLQEQLEGLRRGDKKKVILPESNAGTEYSFDVTIDDVWVATSEEIVLGYPLQTTAETCDDNCDCYT